MNADFRELLPMTLLAGIVLPALELEDNDFVFEAVLHDLTGDLGTAQRGRYGDLGQGQAGHR